MSKYRKYTVCLTMFAIFALSCVSQFDEQPSSVYSSNQSRYIATSQQSQPDSDLEKIVQIVIDLPELQNYYHSEASKRKPLYILKSELVTEEMSLSKFGEPVEFASCTELKKTGNPYLEFVTLKIKENVADAVFRYRVEGIEGRFILNKQSGNWQVQKQEIVEVDFSDKGCAPDKG